MQWLRLYHDTPNDPKWRLVSVRSGQPVGNVLAVWMQMLVCASSAQDRGTLEDWNDEIIAAVLGYAPDAVTAIRAAMQGLVLDGDVLTGWDKRQRSSDNVADRVRRHRAKGQGPAPGGGAGNGQCDTSRDRHAPSRDRNGTETLQAADVTLQTADVTLPPLRAQTTDTERYSVANATGAKAPSDGGRVVQMPLSAKGELFGPVLDDLVAAMPQRTREAVRAMLAKACAKLGPDAALALGKQAAGKDEPWSWLNKALVERTKDQGKAPDPKDPLERFKRRAAEAQAAAEGGYDLYGGAP